MLDKLRRFSADLARLRGKPQPWLTVRRARVGEVCKNGEQAAYMVREANGECWGQCLPAGDPFFCCEGGG